MFPPQKTEEIKVRLLTSFSSLIRAAQTSFTLTCTLFVIRLAMDSVAVSASLRL